MSPVLDCMVLLMSLHFSTCSQALSEYNNNVSDQVPVSSVEVHRVRTQVNCLVGDYKSGLQ